jgi:DNA-binding protein H-NS
MAKTITQINAQIAKLQKEAEALKMKEVPGVVARIKAAIEHYGLTAFDLGFSALSIKPAKTVKPVEKVVAKQPKSPLVLFAFKTTKGTLGRGMASDQNGTWRRLRRARHRSPWRSSQDSFSGSRLGFLDLCRRQRPSPARKTIGEYLPYSSIQRQGYRQSTGRQVGCGSTSMVCSGWP